MKPIIMDMREMSLSKEVYDKKPGLFFSIFIYGLMVIVITALIWAYFGRLDIVIRAQGIIRPHSQTALIINAVGGEVRGVFFYEGKQVVRGDILYMVDTFHLENDRRLLTEQLYNLQFELTTLELFHDSIESGENLINSFNEEHSTRFDMLQVSLNAIEHSASNQLYVIQEERRGLEEALEYARFELSMLRVFENSIARGEDLFGATGGIGRNREVRNTYRNQFLRYALEMDNLNFQIETAQDTLYGYQLIRESVYTETNLFPDYVFSIYRSMYDEFIFQLGQLEELAALAEERYNSYIILHEAGIIPSIEKQAAATGLGNTNAAVLEFSTNYLLNMDSRIRGAETRLTHLKNQAEVLHVGTRASISSQMLSIEASMIEINHAIGQLSLHQGAMFFVDYEAGDAAMLRLGEINRTLGQISTIEQEISRLILSLEGVEMQIDDSTVRAPIDGTVTIHTELTEGSFILGGIQVLSIIPTREEMLSANIFINNNDIGQLLEGMTVSYDIAALPRRDFGEITGTITRISTDISREAGGFFLVESEIEDRVYYDSRGNGVNLRVGMGFEARIVVEQQRILFYLLDRLNLLLN